MALDLAPLVTSTTTADVQADVGALVDRAVAFIRSFSTSETPPTIGRVLAAWRIAERDLEATTPGSETWTQAMERFVLARAEYHRLFTDAVSRADDLRRSW